MCKSESQTKQRRRLSRVPRIVAWICGWLIVPFGSAAVAGGVKAQDCPDPAPQTTGSHSFRRIGETFEIPVALGDCQALSLTVRWSNGRNNGGLFNLTFFDSDNKPLYTKQISAFLTGMFEFPLSSYDYQPYGLVSVSSVPALVTVQAAPPFGLPATLHYTIYRENRRPRSSSGKPRGIDADLASTLQTAPGKLLKDSTSYTLTEVPLPSAREVELHGIKTIVRKVYRVMLKPGQATEAQGRIDLIWINDAALPTFRNLASGGTDVGAVIYDDAVMKNRAEITISNLEATKGTILPDLFDYQLNTNTQTGELGDAGNIVAGISSAVRNIGGRRQQLVQLNLKTARPFPAKETPLRLQIGKRFFSDELSGDYTGRLLTLTLTPEMFAQLREGADIVAFFNRPDRSGFADSDIWYFGKLNKSLLKN